MSDREITQNVWAMTDKSLIDIMTKKTREFPPNEDDSDSESLASQFGPFAAVPKEFRPHLPKTETSNKNSRHENLQQSSKQNLQSTAPKTTVSAYSGYNFPRNKTCVSTNYKPTNSTCQNKPTGLKKAVVSPERGLVFSSCSHAVQDLHITHNSVVDGSADISPKSPDEASKKEIFHTLAYQKKSAASHSKNPKFKEGLKYKCSEKRGHGTIQLNFEIPSDYGDESSLKGKLEYDAVFVQTEKAQKSCLSGASDCLGRPPKVLSQTNIVKWDSSLSLNGKRSDDEDKIEYSVIVERKTLISTRKVLGSSSHKLIEDSSLHTQPPCTNQKKKNFRKKNFNHRRSDKKLSMHGEPDVNKTTKSKTVQESSEKNHEDPRLGIPSCRNNFLLDTIKKEVQNRIRNFEKENYCFLDDNERFSSQCKVSQKNSTSENAIPGSETSMKTNIIDLNVNKINDASTKISQNFNGIEESKDYPTRGENSRAKETEAMKDSSLHYSREVSDLVIGSHTALTLFISFYKEWKRVRLDLIAYFELLRGNLKNSSTRFTKYSDILHIVKTAASLATNVPLPHVSIAAKIISIFSGLFSSILTTAEKSKSEVNEQNDIAIAVARDTSASADLYMYGLQCHQQFEKTARIIEKFHSAISHPELLEAECPEMATFVRGVLEFSPRHRVFYKKLHNSYKELILRTCKSDFGRRFCEPFSLSPPSVIDVIGHLGWRFPYYDFNGESVRYELDQLFRFMQENETLSIKELLNRVQNCIAIMQDEVTFIERSVRDISVFIDSL